MEKKTRITQKKLMAFINSIATTKPSTIPDDSGHAYVSKIDGSYLTRVGMENSVKHLLKRGITEQIKSNDGEGSVCVGFNPVEQKWYGWSHRAIYGFGIGSTCKIGDCGYVPETPKKLFDDVTKVNKDGFRWQNPENVEMTETGIRIKTPMVELVGDDGLVGKTAEFINEACDKIIHPGGEVLSAVPVEPDYWEIECGRGEWTAKTMEDAYRMACDFASGVS